MSQDSQLSLTGKIIVYLRNILALFLLIIFAIFAIIPIIIVYITGWQPPLSNYVRYAIKTLMFILGLKLELVNFNKEIFKKKQWIMIGNHTSFLDPVILFSVVPGTLRFFYKSGVDKVPIISWAFKVSKYISVDRDNPRKAEEAVRRAINIIKEEKADSIGIFPEGTRSRDGKIKRFKRGAFVLAKEHNLPILPVYFKGFYYAMPKGRKLIYPSKLIIEFLEPISEEEVERMSDKELRDLAYDIYIKKEKESLK